MRSFRDEDINRGIALLLVGILVVNVAAIALIRLAEYLHSP